jgi:selenide,water dikinase
MRELNATASEQGLAAGAHAATDVTGFGLLGHAHGLALQSGVALQIRAGAVPALAAAHELLQDAAGISGGTRRNAEWAAGYTAFAPGVADWQRWLLSDATTSGGLLLTVPDGAEREIDGTVIGRVVSGPAGTIAVD